MQNELEVIKTVKEPFSLDMGSLTSKDYRQPSSLLWPSAAAQESLASHGVYCQNVLYICQQNMDNSLCFARRIPLPRVISHMFKDLIWTPEFRCLITLDFLCRCPPYPSLLLAGQPGWEPLLVVPQQVPEHLLFQVFRKIHLVALPPQSTPTPCSF